MAGRFPAGRAVQTDEGYISQPQGWHGRRRAGRSSRSPRLPAPGAGLGGRLRLLTEGCPAGLARGEVSQSDAVTSRPALASDIGFPFTSVGARWA